MPALPCALTFTCAVGQVVNAGTNGLFTALTSWIVAALAWLLGSVVTVLNATSDPPTMARAANGEFTTLLPVAPLLVMAGALVATVQALRHANPSALWWTFGGVIPACVLGIFLARPLAQLVLRAIDVLCAVASSTTTTRVVSLATAVTHLGPIPGFGLFLLAALVVLAALLLWVELLLRTVVLTFLLVLVPLALPLSVVPALRRVGWRLVETFVAVAASKLLIVVALALGLSEVQTGSPTSVLTGVVTLLLASATPFLLLRLVPLVEQSALHGLDGVRQRATRTVLTSPDSPVGRAISALLPEAPLPWAEDLGEDRGIPEADGIGDLPLPPLDGVPPPPPIGVPTVRRGRPRYYTDEWGPVVGWEWDD